MTIYHIVLVKYKPEATPDQRASWAVGMRGLLGPSPQVKDVKSGPKIARDTDGGWEDGVMISFENREDLVAYVTDEAHLKFVDGVLPFMADKLVFDIEALN